MSRHEYTPNQVTEAFKRWSEAPRDSIERQDLWFAYVDARDSLVPGTARTGYFSRRWELGDGTQSKKAHAQIKTGTTPLGAA